MKRVLVLCCGNPIRGDDAAAWKIAENLELLFPLSRVEIVVTQQWLPELAERIRLFDAVFFIDASVEIAPGSISFFDIHPKPYNPGSLSHVLSPCSLLGLAENLYETKPVKAKMLAIGALSLRLYEGLSDLVQDAVPEAVDLLRREIEKLLLIEQEEGDSTLAAQATPLLSSRTNSAS